LDSARLPMFSPPRGESVTPFLVQQHRVRRYPWKVDDVELLTLLRQGDEKAFRQLVTAHHRSLVRLARYYVRSESSAEDVVQETWIAVVRGVDLTSSTPSVDPSRFDAGGAWREPPIPFTERVDDAIFNAPLVAGVRAAIERLPEPHHAVVTLRDVDGLSTSEVAELLDLSEANVRVILHRARARVRSEVETILSRGDQ